MFDSRLPRVDLCNSEITFDTEIQTIHYRLMFMSMKIQGKPFKLFLQENQIIH